MNVLGGALLEWIAAFRGSEILASLERVQAWHKRSGGTRIRGEQIRN